MLGLLEEGTGGWLVRPRAEQVQLLGASACRVTLPASRGRRRLHHSRRCAALLKAAGVRNLLLPLGFDQGDWWRSQGFLLEEEAPLRQALAQGLCLRCLWELGVPPEQAGVVLMAQRVTPAVEQAALDLGGAVRYLRLQTGTGSPGLEKRLRRDFGLSGGLGTATLCVCFDRPIQAPPEPMLGLYAGAEVEQPVLWRLPPGLAGTVGAQIPPGALLCSLWRAGVVRLSEVRWQLPTGFWDSGSF